MSRTTMFPANTVKFGITPTGWVNDDFLDIDTGIPFEQIVSEMALAGFEGCSRGHKYPSDPQELKRALELRDLKISEPWVSTYFTINDMHEQTFESFEKEINFLKQMQSGDLVLAELGGSSHQQPIALVPNAPKFSDEQWRRLADGLNELGHKANCHGITMCYHHHMGTGVMTMDAIAKLAELTDPNCVNFCLDTGHLFFAGGDNLEFINLYGERIKHVHLKNIRKDVMDYSLANDLSFKEAILRGVFTVPGDPAGCLDFKEILQALADKSFAGWLIVEAEQNPANANPLLYAQMARKYLQEVTGL
ncbi:myo-inosose-2 dehydratase [Pseudoalteromonas luteoviolacea]|uniref:myo-inosose-2 dehydratase n=1 Tax=Pseudoalteromonas luteoviolacea TaxID=43657 RepID=UPI001153E29C|nr:myo-inosose-2 dehydratase [Pseudoalteromonas luteoviolacea]TQF71360.1 myo-inosose-2 dehydratase [Pseudoalteromonas luteoviolacea]